MTKTPRMYTDTETWNPFKGCRFECTYCKPSFQRQAKRQKKRCKKCYDYTPHVHAERLKKMPSSKIIFVAGNGDISFCDPGFTREILGSIKKHNVRAPGKTFYLQSKRPEYFQQFLGEFPDNVILVTTLETNRDQGYDQVSKAPVPSERYRQFLSLNYPRKVVTIEPLMDFDADVFSKWMADLRPEYVWLGFNSHAECQIPEPPAEKVLEFAGVLRKEGIPVKPKELRGLQL
jgi:hypothetical protein